MSILIFGTEVNKTKISIERIYYYHDFLTEEEKVGGYYIEDIPTMPTDIPDGKGVRLYFNPKTNEAFYEFIELPPRPKTEVDILKEKVATLEAIVAELKGSTGS